jgi:hypothetical protein
MGVMGLDALIDAQLYMHSRQQCDDSHPEKKCLSISTTRAIQTRDQGAKMFGSLKDSEVCGVHKKEHWDKWIRSINPIGTIICPKHEMKVKILLDRVIRVSVRSVPAFSGYLVGLRYLRNNFRADHFGAH